jgi:hypothetical protein
MPFIVTTSQGDNIALKRKGRVHELVKGRIMLYITSDIPGDSAFPFKPKKEVDVEISGDKVLVKKLEKLDPTNLLFLGHWAFSCISGMVFLRKGTRHSSRRGTSANRMTHSHGPTHREAMRIDMLSIS